LPAFSFGKARDCKAEGSGTNELDYCELIGMASRIRTPILGLTAVWSIPSPFETAVVEPLFCLEGCSMKLILDEAQTGHCPDCGSASLHRSRRKDFVESFLHYALFISPYRCDECYERHFRFRSVKDVEHAPSQRTRHAS